MADKLQRFSSEIEREKRFCGKFAWVAELEGVVLFVSVSVSVSHSELGEARLLFTVEKIFLVRASALQWHEGLVYFRRFSPQK